jgi:hypothetical protein
VRRAVVIGAVIVALVAALALRLWHSESPPAPTAERRGEPRTDMPEVPTVAPESLINERPAQRSNEDDGSYEARVKFHERVRAYFTDPSSIPATQRRAHAEALEDDVIRYESRGELSADEARLLRLELARTSVTDAAERDALIAAIHREYEQATQSRLAQWESQRDPNFEVYKVREAEVVAGVMQMTEIPGGLSRDEYLRQRLQQERERLMR